MIEIPTFGQGEALPRPSRRQLFTAIPALALLPKTVLAEDQSPAATMTLDERFRYHFIGLRQALREGDPNDDEVMIYFEWKGDRS